MSDKPPLDSLKYQWRLLATVLRSAWATGLDKTLAFEIIDNYRKDFGNSRASLSYLQKASGADRKAVIASTRRLTGYGPFSVIRAGAGTRPTEYKLHFELVHENASSGAQTTTTETDSSSGMQTTTGGGAETTTRSASGGVETTESVLPDAAYKAGIQDRMIDFAPPGAPPLAGLPAATAGPAKEGGFEELWRSYNCKQKKAEARAAYVTLNPDDDLHARMVEAAGRWFSRWAEQGRKDAPRFTLAKWLEREEYECEPPAAYQAKERKTAKPDAALVDAETPPEKPDFTIYPDRSASGMIERSEISTDEEDGAVMLSLWFRTTDGEAIEHLIICQSHISEEQENGQKELRMLLDAVGLNDISDSDDLIGRPVDLMLTHHGKFVSCSRPWTPAPREPRNVPRFADVVSTTKPGGWALKIGEAYADDPELDAA